MLDHSVAKLYGSHPQIPTSLSLAQTVPEHLKKEANKYGGVEYKSPCHVGIEVETEGIDNPGACQSMLWKATKDGSLKVKGIEYVSQPIKDYNIPYALADLENVWKENKKSVFSHRCSIHVHLDAHKLTYQQLLVLVGFYLSIERVLFTNLFPNRLGNAYCFPLTDVGLTRDMIGLKYMKPETFKYAALNLFRLTDYGTIEFRHHPGTKDGHELKHWLEILFSIYKFGLNTSLDDFNEKLMNLNTTSYYHEYIKSVFPFWNVDVTRREMYNAVTAAKLFINS